MKTLKATILRHSLGAILTNYISINVSEKEIKNILDSDYFLKEFILNHLRVNLKINQSKEIKVRNCYIFDKEKNTRFFICY